MTRSTITSWQQLAARTPSAFVAAASVFLATSAPSSSSAAAAPPASLARAAILDLGWPQQGGSDFRANTIYIDSAQADVAAPSAVSYVSLGRHTSWQYVGVAAANPIVPAVPHLAIIPDATNRLKGFVLPENSPTNTLDLSWTFAPSSINPKGGISSSYSGSAVSNGSAVFWVCWQTSYLWGADTSQPGAPVALPWAPLNLTAASGTKHFATWNSEHSILYHDHYIWVPATDEHEALRVDSRTGAYVLTTFAANPARLLGSVGITTQSGHAMAFVATTYHMQSLNEKAKQIWASDVAFAPVGAEFSHPVLFTFAGTATRCVILSRQNAGGLLIMAVKDTDGTSCSSWSKTGFNIRNKYTASPSWTSAPAVIVDTVGTGAVLYFAINLPNGPGPDGVTAVFRSSLVAVRIDTFGPVSVTDVQDGYIFTGAQINMAPVAFLDAYGVNKHAIAVVLSTGEVNIFRADAGAITAGPLYTFPASTVLTMPSTSGSNPAVIMTAGNYAAATAAGTLIFAAYEPSTRESYMVAVSRAVYGPRGGGPAPSPSPDPAIAAEIVAETHTAEAVFGSIGGILAACAAIVYFAPTASFRVGGLVVTPAETIKSGASAVAGAGRFVLRSITGSGAGSSASRGPSGSGERSKLMSSNSSFSSSSGGGSHPIFGRQAGGGAATASGASSGATSADGAF